MGSIQSSDAKGPYRVPHPDSVATHFFDRSCITDVDFNTGYVLPGCEIKHGDATKIAYVHVSHSLDINTEQRLGTAMTLEVRIGDRAAWVHFSSAHLDALSSFWPEATPEAGSTVLEGVEVATNTRGVWDTLPVFAVSRGEDPSKVCLHMTCESPEVNRGLASVFGVGATLWLQLEPVHSFAPAVWRKDWCTLAAGVRDAAPAALQELLWSVQRRSLDQFQVGCQLTHVLRLLQCGGRPADSALGILVAALRVSTLGNALTMGDVTGRCVLTMPLPADAAAALQGLLLQVRTGEIRVPEHLAEFVEPDVWCTTFGVSTTGLVAMFAEDEDEDEDGDFETSAKIRPVFGWCTHVTSCPRDGFGCMPQDYLDSGRVMQSYLWQPVGPAGVNPCQQALLTIAQVPSLLGSLSDAAAAAMNPAALIAAKQDLVQQLRTWAAMVTLSPGSPLSADLPSVLGMGVTSAVARAAGVVALFHGPLSAFLLAAVPGQDWSPGGMYIDAVNTWIHQQVGSTPHDEVVKALVAFSDSHAEDKSDAAANAVVQACLARVFAASPGKARLADVLWQLVVDMFATLRECWADRA